MGELKEKEFYQKKIIELIRLMNVEQLKRIYKLAEYLHVYKLE